MAKTRKSKSGKPYKTVKYSNETMANSGELIWQGTALQHQLAVVPEADIQGMRKAKNFTIKFSSICSASTTAGPIVWALVFVPQGTSPSELSSGTGTTSMSLYEPNQNVIMSGNFLPTLSEPATWTAKTRLARNLNSKDSIYFLIKSDANMTIVYSVTINYALTYS